jgi:GNAT superfamily N-acetyltransferase
MNQLIYKLDPTMFRKVTPFLETMDYNLAPRAVIEGNAPGDVYVDDGVDPRAALIHVGHRFYLVGTPDNEAFNGAVGGFFTETVYPQAIAEGKNMFVLYYAPDGWSDRLDAILPGKFPRQDMRQAYSLEGSRDVRPSPLPDGFVLRDVDRDLLNEDDLGNLDDLVEEVHSEAPSVDDFLANRFGVCVVHEGALVGWCLSEYNCGDRCEVGIETVEEYRRRGIATAMATALARRAFSSGITHVGWHCWADNAGSIATALKAGFEKVRDYQVAFAWFDELTNLAVHGNLCFRDGEIEEAVAWFERAMRIGDAPAWVYWNAACANARLGEDETAMAYVHRAIDAGFDDLEHLRNSEHLKHLHDRPGWRALIDRLISGGFP